MNDRIVATIAAVFSDGVTVTFPTGETSSKHYKCNTSAGLAAGDRVVLSRIGGTYVVDYKIGAPNSEGSGGGAVTSVNGKTGAVQLTASDVSARPSTWVPTAAQVGARPSTWMPSAADVGARPDTWTPSAADVGAIPDEAISMTTLTTASGLTNVTGSCEVVYYRRGNIMTISVQAKPNTANTWVTIFTLPAGYRPPLNVNTNIGGMDFLIRTDGAFRIKSASTTANSLALITFGI